MCQLLPCPLVCSAVGADCSERAQRGAEDGWRLCQAQLDSRPNLVQPFPQLPEHRGIEAARDAAAECNVDFLLRQVEPDEAGANERGDLVEEVADDPGGDRVALRL